MASQSRCSVRITGLFPNFASLLFSRGWGRDP